MNEDVQLPDECAGESNPSQPVVYEIRLRDHLCEQWADWFEGAAIAPQDNGDTILRCTVSDQAALHGLLKKVRDLGMSLISVNRVEPGRTDASAAK